MPFFCGKNYTRKELLTKVGHISQVGGARQIKLAGGQQEGVEACEFRTGSGFNFLAMPGRGLDISIAEHNGRAIAWRAPVGEVNAAFYEEPGLGWLRSFPGGLVATCGLTYAGAPNVDEGEALGLHGRYTNTPASNVWVDGAWEGDEYRIWAQGKVRESRLFFENVVMNRRISALLGQSKLWIEDEVTNESPRTLPHMIVYHINGGFPAVDAGSELISPTKNAVPRDAEAEKDKEHFFRNDPPTEGFSERCYYHEMAADSNGDVYAALVNKNFPGGPFGFYIKYKLAQLPYFVQWKMNGIGEYVVGIEPANCRVGGRDAERKAGTLQFLEPGETRKYNIEIGVITNAEELKWIEGKVRG